MIKETELKPCPFCGHAPGITAPFGTLCVSCHNPKCLMKPSTWLNCSDSTDLRVVAKHWNARK